MEKNLVDFGQGRTFDKTYLEHHSRLYQHISEIEPSIVVWKIDMPNLFEKFSSDIFDDLHDFINKRRISHRADNIDKQIEDTFQLMLALDMPSIINLAVNGYTCLERKILQYDVFEACLESQHPFNLLQDMLANPDWEISTFAIGKLSRFISEEDKRNRPSNKVLYIIQHRSTKHIFVLDRSVGCLPVLVTIKKDELLQLNGQYYDTYAWYSSDINNVNFFHTSGLDWIGWIPISSAMLSFITMRYYTERGKMCSAPRKNDVDNMDCFKLVDQSEITTLVYIVDLYSLYIP